jgi:hypothetical protein
LAVSGYSRPHSRHLSAFIKPAFFCINIYDLRAKKPPAHCEKRASRLFSSLPADGKKLPACDGLELAPGTAGLNCRRLPWFHRASPSATLNEIRYINEYG